MSDAKAGRQTERKAPDFLKAPYAILAQTAKVLGVTEAEVSKRLGYATVSTKWKASGEIPFVAALACRTLESEVQTGRTNVAIIVKTVDDAQHKLVVAMLTQMNIAHIEL